MGVVAVEIPKGSGRWWIRIRWQFAPGKRWRKSKLIGIGDEAKDAAMGRARLLNDAWARFGKDAIRLVEPDLPEKPKPVTVGEYAARFLARMRSSGLKRSTLSMYRTNLLHHVLPELGARELQEINYRVLADFLSAKAEARYDSARFRKPREGDDRAPGQRRAYSRDSIRIMAMTVRALMAEAVKDGIVPTNPVAGLSRFYRRRRADRQVRRSDVLTAEELHAVEDRFAERHPEYWELVLAMSREGIRIGEAMALEESDLDLRRGTIAIDKNVPAGTGVLEESAKTESSDREIEIWSEDLREALRAMLRRRLEEGLAGAPASTHLFREASGRRVDYGRFVKAWNRCQRLAGVRQRSPHSLRHTWASQMIAAGEDIGSVARHLGHANPGITLAIYTHFLPRKRRLSGTVLDRGRRESEGEDTVDGGEG